MVAKLTSLAMNGIVFRVSLWVAAIMYYWIGNGNFYIISTAFLAQNGLCDMLNLAKCNNSIKISSIINVESASSSINFIYSEYSYNGSELASIQVISPIVNE
jgi:hypothetical protein